MVEVLFGPKKLFKNGMYHFYPSAKSRIELIIKTSGVICRGASAHHVQKTIAPPKRHFLEQKIDPKWFWKKIAEKFFWASKNWMSGIVWNTFSQSYTPNGAIFGGQTAVQSLQFFSASNNEMLGILWNVFWPSFAPIGTMFGGQTADRKGNFV